MATKTLKPEKVNQVEQTAQEMRQFVRAARRKLLEFEVMMSQREVTEGKAETFAHVDELLDSAR